MICTFFGHKDTPQEIQPKPEKLLIELIKNSDEPMFYVGNQGGFDCMVRKTLKQLQKRYPQINYAVVLAYLPTERKENDSNDYSDTIYPFAFESVLPRYAIDKRNHWMLAKADTVVTYVKHPAGGASHFKALAEKSSKRVINLE